MGYTSSHVPQLFGGPIGGGDEVSHWICRAVGVNLVFTRVCVWPGHKGEHKVRPYKMISVPIPASV